MRRSARAILFTLVAILLLAGLRAPAKEGQKPVTKPASIKLFGHIDELSLMCSSVGIRLSGTSLPAKIDKVSLGSAAAYGGLRTGDRVVSARPQGTQLILDIERNAKRYQSSVATDVDGLKEQFEKRGVKWSINEGAFDKELQDIGKFNVVILLDRTASMLDHHVGCPGDMTKWAWCRQQLDGLYFATARILDNGFDLVPFNNTFQRWNDITLWDLKMVFNRYKPDGSSKNIAAPLEAVLEDRAHWHVKTDKPLLIVVLTDGIENQGRPLEHVLIEASQKFSAKRDVKVVFLQVGDSVVGDELFSDLDQNLMAKGGAYNMVSYKPFSEVRERGLVAEIMQLAQESQ